jgi:hypothetical protein
MIEEGLQDTRTEQRPEAGAAQNRAHLQGCAIGLVTQMDEQVDMQLLLGTCG